MSKLYFRYGAMSSSKTLQLLTVAHNYDKQNKKVFVIKPKLDTRFSDNKVVSRAGLSRQADLLVEKTTNLMEKIPQDTNVVLVD